MLPGTMDHDIIPDCRFYTSPLATSNQAFTPTSAPSTPFHPPSMRQHQSPSTHRHWSNPSPGGSTQPFSNSAFTFNNSPTACMQSTNPIGYILNGQPTPIPSAPYLGTTAPVYPSCNHHTAHNAGAGSPVCHQNIDLPQRPDMSIVPMEFQGLGPSYLESSYPHTNSPLQARYWDETWAMAHNPEPDIPKTAARSPYAHASNVGLLSMQPEQGQQVAPPPPPSPGTSQPHQLSRTDISFVLETPNKPPTVRDKRRRTKEEERKQREDSRLLRGRGGACVWCYLSKKKCDTDNTCAQCISNKRPCIRECSQLWLFISDLERPQKNMPFARKRTFEHAHEVLSRFKKTSNPRVTATRVRVTIQRVSDESFRHLLDAPIADLQISDDTITINRTNRLIDQLTKSTLANIKLDGCIIGPAANDSMVKSAGYMLRLLAAIKTLSSSVVSVHPASLGIARTTMFFILTLHAMALCEESATFSNNLCDIIRRNRHHQEHTAQAAESEALNPVWLAVGMYHQVIVGLISFEPRQIISDIFGEIELRLDDIQRRLRGLLASIPRYQGSKVLLRMSMLDSSLEENMPDIPFEEDYCMAVWVSFSEAQGTTSTTASRQEMAHHQLRYSMKDLLHEDFEMHLDYSNQSLGQPSTRFPHVTIPPHTTVIDPEGTGCNDSLTYNKLEDDHASLEDGGADTSPRNSDQQSTVDDDVFTELIQDDRYTNSSLFTLRQDTFVHGQVQLENDTFSSFIYQDDDANILDPVASATDTSYTDTRHISMIDFDHLDL